MYTEITLIDSAVYEVPDTPSDYESLVRSGDWSPDGLTPPKCTEEFASAALGLLHGRLKRKGAIKRIFGSLFPNYIRDCRLKFKLYDKRVAYMTDKGDVCFSSASICRGTGAFVLKLVLHEAAHLWLREQADYDKLKALQKAVRAQYQTPHADFLPIEYYAVSLSVKMLEMLLPEAKASDREQIRNQINCEKSKLVILSRS